MKGPAYEEALAVARKLRRSGHQAVFAGGCVRDILLGVEPQDYDVATDATPAEVKKLFRRTVPVGEEFGVIIVLQHGQKVEVTTFRTEGSYSDGRRPDRVDFVSAKDDVLRRDFTINALLMDPESHEVIDHVGGREDLKARLIRAVGEPARRFGEDHLRLLRAVRFAARLGFSIEDQTRQAITEMAAQVLNVSGERIRNELDRIITDPSRAAGIRLMDEVNLLAHILPDVHALKSVPNFVAPIKQDVFEHTLAVMDLLRTPSFVLALAALLHDSGKPRVYTLEDRPRFARHEVVGEEIARAVCERLRTSAEERESVAWLVHHHMLLCNARKMRLSRLKRLFAEERFLELAELFRADSTASAPAFAGSDYSPLDDYEHAMSLYRSLPAEEVQPPRLITGDDLISMGLQPGPLFADLLERVRDAQLEGTLKTREEALALVRDLLREKGQTPGRGDHPA